MRSKRQVQPAAADVDDENPRRHDAKSRYLRCPLRSAAAQPIVFLASIAEARAGFKSLHDKWADSTSPHGRLSLTVLGGLAEFERELIRARTGEGRKRAQERGVRFGRPAALTSHQRHEARQRLSQGDAQADVARSFNVSRATISRLA